MRAMRWWWGMLCVAGMACGDEAPLGARPEPRGEVRDLEFVLPAVKGTPALVSRAETFTAEAGTTADVDGQASISEGTTAPLIWTTDVTGQFVEQQYRYSYAMTGFGSGYTMSPHVDIMTTEGTRLPVNMGPGRSEDLFYAWRFRPSVQGVLELGRDCGMIANLTVQFEARMAGRILNTSREQRQGQSNSSAKACTSTVPTGSGGGGPGTVYYLTICSYELIVDMYGNVIDVLYLGCSTVALPYAQ